MIVWVFLVAAWPLIVIYLIGPLIWASAEEAGALNPILQYFPAALYSVALLVWNLSSDRAEISLGAALIGSLFAFVAVAVWFSGLTQLPNFVMAGMLFSGVVVKRKITSVEKLGVAALVSLCAVVVAITVGAVVNAGGMFADCRVDKCGVTDVALTSPLAGNGNVLGMATVLLATAACAALPLFRTVLLLVGVAALQLLALSRTAMFALVVVAIALVALKSVRSAEWKLRLSFAALGVAFCASIAPLFMSFSGSSFSYRGYVWEAALDSIGDAPVFGHGPSYWHIIAQSALFDANYSPHNGWYDLLIAVGAWGLVVILVGVTVQLSTTAGRALPYLITYYAAILAINTFESVYVPYFFGIMPFAALLPLMVYEPKPALQTNGVSTQVPTTQLDAERGNEHHGR
ncbi:O-antigen ligase family protein [Mycolicibacterium novocastrense]|nr:O-antigen ligase family protein [Mycolicibacterium novocastrense]